MSVNLLSFILVLVFTVGVIKYLLHVKYFLKRIESNYPKLWLSMGMPKFGFQFGDTRYRKAMLYIRKHEFSDLNDEVLELEYRKILFLEKMAWGIFIALLALSVYPAL
ncbi:MAG: hypothetical protein U9R50_00620 [Campylobacterota bacterium]|nr:hypothetical protein [Campylobacterota bacterium]